MRLGLTKWSRLVIAALVTISCAPVEVLDDAPPGAFDLATAEIVDLSYAYDESTLFWPTSPSRFALEVLAFGPTAGGYFYSANALSTPEHGGTHLDAPIHFAEGGWATDEIPLERLVGPAVVIDVSRQAEADADYRLSREDVLAWEGEYGRIAADTIVLLRTGWGQFWPEAEEYLGDDTPGDASNLHFPGFGESAARLLVEDRGVAMIGVDTASIDYGPSTDFIVHQIANGANVPALENVASLDQLPETGAWIVALPMKIGGGSGGPARIIALVPASP